MVPIELQSLLREDAESMYETARGSWLLSKAKTIGPILQWVSLKLDLRRMI